MKRRALYNPGIVTILAVLLVLTGMANARAQSTIDELLLQPGETETPSSPQEQGTTPDAKPLEDVPDEFIAEAIAFYDRCEASDNMRQYYDCKCLSAKFLDERIERAERGENPTSSAIVLAVENECKSGVEAAGSRYEDCLANTSSLPDHIKPEPYCACVANTYGKLFEDSKRKPSGRLRIKLETQARISCRDPQLGYRLFRFTPR